MKVTVIGASGLIGTKVVDLLTNNGHEVVASSRKTGVDVLTGEGLADALTGADTLVDVTNAPSFEDDPVMEFFKKSTTNLVDAARAAGVRHYVVLSIVGVDGRPRWSSTTCSPRPTPTIAVAAPRCPTRRSR